MLNIDLKTYSGAEFITPKFIASNGSTLRQ